MDKSFNFFKTKIKKQNERVRHNSKSNSSKYSYSKCSDKGKPTHIKPAPLTKKQREIREAIEYRYQKSKIKNYHLVQPGDSNRGDRASSHSSQMAEFKHLRKMNIVDLKQYHRKLENHSNSSSQDKKKFNLRFKIKQNASSSAIRTEGNQSSEKQSNQNPYLSKGFKNHTPTKISKKTEEWKFISIQLKEDLSKPKNRKTQVKINSHRSYNVQQKPTKMKQSGSSSMNKYFDKVPKLKELHKLNKTKF